MFPLIIPVFPSWGSSARKQLLRRMLGELHPGFDFVLHDWPIVELEVQHRKSGLRTKAAPGRLSVFLEAKKRVKALQEEVCYRGR